MCGILAYMGQRKTRDVLLEGLNRLQYRGYDSAGLVIAEQPIFIKARAVGNLKNLIKKTSSGKWTKKGGCGMGHTRWATHGSVSEKNAHPHKAGPLYVVHNGIIENAKDLKKTYFKKTSFLSETDTEVIAHLLNHFYQKTGSLKKAVFKILSQIKGQYAVVLMSEKHPKEIWAFKKGPSLILGLSPLKKEIFIASDIQAFQPYTRQAVFLKDHTALHITQPHKFQFYCARTAKSIKKKTEIIGGDSLRADDKGKNKFYMFKEIKEQPVCLQRVLGAYLNKNQTAFPDQNKFIKNVLSRKKLCITACGSSYYSALYGKYVIEKWAGISVEVDTASEFRWRAPVQLERKTPVILISQSGETADTLAVLNKAKEKHCQVLALCNSMHSTLERESSAVLKMLAGVEKGVASTKAFTSTLLILYLLALDLARKNNKLSSAVEKQVVKNLLNLPDQAQEILDRSHKFSSLAQFLKPFKFFIYLGRGWQYPLALEGALKMKELSYKPALGYPAGEMKHGPLALIDNKTAVVGLLPSSKSVLYQKTLINLEEAKARKAKIIIIGEKSFKSLKTLADQFISVPSSAHEEQLAILNALPLQLMAGCTALSLGHNIDQPRNLAKSVTVE